MKNILIIALSVLFQSVLFCQNETISIDLNNGTCGDTSKFYINTEGTYAEINIKVKDDWRAFLIMNETIGNFKYDCDLIDLYGGSSKELVINWSNANYGSGGGTTIKGIQIWDLEFGQKILGELVYCSEEVFGKEDIEASFSYCKKPLKIKKQVIKVSETICNEEWGTRDATSEESFCCKVSSLQKGSYSIKNGAIIKLDN